MHKAVHHLEIGTKIAVGGAAVAFAHGVHRHRIRQEIAQRHVNAYAAAVIHGRAEDLAARKDARRDRIAADILAGLGRHD